ncbi:MAG: arginine-tRNA-protein transferase [Acidobacteriota bacterium]
MKLVLFSSIRSPLRLPVDHLVLFLLMLDVGLTFIHDEFEAAIASPDQLDRLLADGWRHFGTHFYRYNLGFYREDIRRVIPLRIRVADFSLSKSQRRVLRKNADLKTIIRPTEITKETESLFHKHKQRFDHGVPDSIYDFLSLEPAIVPCEAKEVAVYKEDELVAVSYFDVGARSTSGIYAMFEPAERTRGLGIFTMLKEIEFSIESGRETYYQGYCYEGESFYDYKKRFRGTECFDWNGNWRPFANVEVI